MPTRVQTKSCGGPEETPLDRRRRELEQLEVDAKQAERLEATVRGRRSDIADLERKRAAFEQWGDNPVAVPWTHKIPGFGELEMEPFRTLHRGTRSVASSAPHQRQKSMMRVGDSQASQQKALTA